MKQFLRTFWLAESSAECLGRARALFFSSLFLIYGVEHYWRPDSVAAWARLPETLWMPIGLTRLWGPLSPVGLLYLQQFWFLALALSALGLVSRWATSVSFLLGCILVEHTLGYGVWNWSDLWILPLLFVFAVSPCADDFSLDNRWRSRTTPQPKILPHSRYGWPLQFARCLVVVVFFGSGLAKLHMAGLAWVTQNQVSDALHFCAYMNFDSPPSTLFLARHPLWGKVLGATLLTLELASPIALCSKEWRPWLLGLLGWVALLFYGSLQLQFFKLLSLFLLCFMDDSVSKDKGPGSLVLVSSLAAVVVLGVQIYLVPRCFPWRSFDGTSVEYLAPFAKRQKKFHFTFSREYPIQRYRTFAPLTPLDMKQVLTRFEARGGTASEMADALLDHAVAYRGKGGRYLVRRQIKLYSIRWQFREWLGFKRSRKRSFFHSFYRPESFELISASKVWSVEKEEGLKDAEVTPSLPDKWLVYP